MSEYISKDAKLKKIRKLFKLQKVAFSKNVFISVFILSGLSFLSCGLNDEAPADASIYDLGNLNGACELNTGRLHNILDEDVSKDINCLEVNLDQFVQFVRREDPSRIGRLELNKFIDKFFPESQEIARNLLKLVYDLNSILLRDQKDSISVKKIKKLFDLFRITNTEGRFLYQELTGLNKDNYWSRRKSIYQKTETLVRKILSVITSVAPAHRELKITSFIEELKSILDLNDDQLDIDKIRSFLFAKKLILGGDKEVISSDQIVTLLDKSSNLLLLGMDALFASTKNHGSKEEEYFFYYDIVKELKGQFAPHNDTDLILEQKDLMTVTQEFLGDKYNAGNMDQSIQTFKKKFFGGAPDQYLFRDVMTLANWGLEFSGMLYFNEVTYSYYQKELSSPKAVSGLTLPKMEHYHVFPDWLIKRLWENFDYISSNYRFFHDQDGRSHFFNYYKRYRSGFNTASMLRWAVRKVVQVYGHYPPGKRRKEADTEDFKTLLLDLEGLLKEFGLWPTDLDKFATEAIASSDLFMYHADGNDSSSSEELTEYAVNALHGFKIANTIHTQMQKYCDLVGEDGQSIAVPCFREYFLHVFFNDLHYQKYYNKLYEYLNLNGSDELRKYLINIELYARIDPNPELPITKEDLNRIVVILSNLESAYLRFDVDKDGILSRGELDLAFLVFKNLVIKVAGLGNSGDGLYKSIFLYLVKHMEVPSPLKLIWFHVFGKKKDITSSRYNISAILKNFSVE